MGIHFSDNIDSTMNKVSRRNFLFSSSILMSLASHWMSYSSGKASIHTQSDIFHTAFEETEGLPFPFAPKGMYAPPKGDIRLAIFSDLNSRYGSKEYIYEVKKAVQLLPEWKPDLVICAGDMVAGQSLRLTNSQVQAMWTAFDRKIFQPIRSLGLPYAMTLGNHDASSYQDRSGQFVFSVDRQEAQRYWKKQDLGLDFIDKSGFPFFYSFLFKDLFFLIWDASSATISDHEIYWANKLLGSEIAKTSRMKIVMGHLPMYAVANGRDRQGEILNRADQIRALLEKHQVHTYICGHHHVYFPGRVGQLEMLHVGALGSGPRSWLSSTKNAMHTITLVDVNLSQKETQYTTYNMGNSQVIPIKQIPRVIVGPNGREIRRDLTFSDLTPTEKNLRHILSK